MPRHLLHHTMFLPCIRPAAPPALDPLCPRVLQARLLAHIAGLDRGFAANARQAELVESAVQALVSSAGPVQLTSPPSAPAPGKTESPPAAACCIAGQASTPPQEHGAVLKHLSCCLIPMLMPAL